MPFNEILVETGAFGAYQKILTFGYLSLSFIVVAFTTWTQIFILLIPPHRFKRFENDTEWITSSNESDQPKTDPCHVIQFSNNETSYKQDVIYDFSSMFPTYSSENNLVCENAWKAYFAHTVYWVASIFGTILFGILNDKYGRRRAYQSAIMLSLIADVTTYFCKEYIYFLVFRFFSSLGGSSIATISFILVTEYSIPSKRRVNIFVTSFTFAIASLGMVWMAKLVYDWRYILIISWIPSSTAIITSYFIPESASWLITKGRVEEAIGSIHRIARVNGKTINQDFIIHHLQDNEKAIEKEHKAIETLSQSTEKIVTKKQKDPMSCYRTLFAVLKSPNLRKRILCLGFLWLAACICYNGVTLEFQYLPYNMYITYSIGAIIEIPGIFLILFTVDVFGRRWLNAAVFIAGGIFGILGANAASKSLILTLAVVMRFCYSVAFDITFSYSNEIIPTEIRGRTMSFIRTCGGIGSALAPFIVSLAQKDALLPLSCFGIVAVLAGLLMLTLPETCNQQLLQTIDDGENYGIGQSFWYCPFLRNQQEKEKKDLKGKNHLESSVNAVTVLQKNPVRCVRIHKLLTD